MSKQQKNNDTPVLYQTLIVKSARVEASSIDQWQTAVNSAKRGERSKLYDLYDNILADGILANALEKRVNAITNAELAFIRDGKNVEEIDDLIDTTEFEELLKEIVLSKAYGKSVIEIMFNPEFNIFSYPRKNIKITNLDKPMSEHRRFIAAKDGDREGYDYTTDNRFIDCGKDTDLGCLFKAAPYVIYKRGGFGDWAQFVEIFGMPFMVGKYNSYDTKARDMLFKALEEIGSNPRAAIPNETDIDIKENKSSGSSGLYREFRAACNEEMLIAVLGNTMTTVQGEKGARSLGEVHQETEEKINQSDRRFVARTLNRYLLPLLIERGYNAGGGYFVFPDAGENMTITQRIDLALKIKKEGIPIDDNYIYDISGIPRPATEKGKTGKTKEAGKTGEKEKTGKEGKNEKFSPASPISPISPTVPPVPIVPKVPIVPEKTLLQKLLSFFVNAPAHLTGAMQNFTTKSTTNTNSNSDITIDINALFLQALQNIYGNAGSTHPAVEKPLFDITNATLQSGIDRTFNVGVEFGQKNQDFINQFKYNTAVFSAFKNHHQTNEIVALLHDEEGNLRSFHEFRKLANRISKDYNQRWLQTEYNTAVRAARSAVNWKKYQESKHLYPNLEYIISTASEKSRRKIHESWVGTVLPIDHEWWDTHMPPSDWNCKCSVRPTDLPETAIPEVEDTGNPTFRNNPGKSAQFIKLNEHPYIKGLCPHVGNCPRQNSLNLSHQSLLTLTSHLSLNDPETPPYRPECEICTLASLYHRIEENRKLYESLLKDPNYKDVQFNPQNGGLMATHKDHNFDPNRGHYEKNVQKVGYNNGNSVVFGAEKNKAKSIKSNEGIWDGKPFEIRGCETATINNITNGLFHCATKPGTKYAVLYFPNNNFDASTFNHALNRYATLGKTSKYRNIYREFEKIIIVSGTEVKEYKK